MKVVNSNEMREIDRYTIDNIGIPGIVLMENAAMAVVSETIQLIRKCKKIVICCGIGNNGGDGFAIARILKCNNIDVSIVIIGDTSKIKGDAKINYDIARKLDINIFEYSSEEKQQNVENILENSDVIFDSIFGTGLCREITGKYLEIINIINKVNAYKIAVDIPSGLNANTGHVLGACILADKTISFCLPKVGLLLYPGLGYVGDLIIADIGIPNRSLERIESNISIMDDYNFRNFMPKRKAMSHKGTYGKILVIAGTEKMAGAAVMTTLASYRTGAGLVKTFIEESISSIITTCVPEAIIETYTRNGNNLLEEDKNKLLDNLKWADTIAIGPGLSNDDITREMLEIIINNYDKKIVIDADGINVLAKDLDILNKRKSEIVITPHIGEMSRLTKYSISDITNNTINIAREFSEKYGVTCVLKSSRTITASKKGIVNINIYGNSGMATAGSGDVLTGIIVSLIAQGMNPFDGAILGVYIHSKAGDKAKEEVGEYALIANDIINSIPYVMKLGYNE